MAIFFLAEWPTNHETKLQDRAQNGEMKSEKITAQ